MKRCLERDGGRGHQDQHPPAPAHPRRPRLPGRAASTPASWSASWPRRRRPRRRERPGAALPRRSEGGLAVAPRSARPRRAAARPGGRPSASRLLLPRLHRDLLPRCGCSPPGRCARGASPSGTPSSSRGRSSSRRSTRRTCCTSLWPSPVFVSWLLTLHLPLAALAAYWLARELGAVAGGGLRGRGGLRPRRLRPVVPEPLRLPPGAGPRPARGGDAAAGGRCGGRTVVVAGGRALALALSTLAVEFVAQAVAPRRGAGRWSTRPGAARGRAGLGAARWGWASAWRDCPWP